MSIVNHGCRCAACMMRTARDEKAHEESMAALKAAIERGDFDHLKPNSNESKGGQS